MFRRVRGAVGAVSGAVDSVSPYADQLASNEKLRQRLAGAIRSGVAARRRARRQVGLLGVAARLGSDPVLREQIVDAYLQLRKARRRVQKQNTNHGARNLRLFVVGSGLVVAAVPKLRRRVVGQMRRFSDHGWTTRLSSSDLRPTRVVQQIEVNAPVSTVYAQWTRFEQFPTFMEGVDEVKRLDDTLLHWAVTVAGKKAEWNAKITEQDPDRRIAWESVDGKQTLGNVSFEPVGSGTRTSVRLEMSYTPQGAAEPLGSAVGLDQRRVKGDLERFRDLVESRREQHGLSDGGITDDQKEHVSDSNS
jgi:uncharacterized membrane protein